MRIDILNPKAAKLLRDLADLNLIAIQDSSKSGFASVLKKLRSKAKSVPTLEEITKEVELVRSKRYAKKVSRIIIDTNLWISFLITKDLKKYLLLGTEFIGH